MRRYATGRPGAHGGTAATPIPLSGAKFTKHLLLREILRPYATTPQSATLSARTVYFLATDLLELRGAQLRSEDPRYRFSATIANPLDRAIIRLLLKDRFRDHDSLARETSRRWRAKALDASLAHLLDEGIVLHSNLQ
jgi:hypothetical protein